MSGAGRRRLVVAAGLAALAAGCTTEVRRSTDDARDGSVSVWLHTPYVAVGDDLVLEVGAFDDPEVGLKEVLVYFGDAPTPTVDYGDDVYGEEHAPKPVDEPVAQARGKGLHWGNHLTTSDNSFLWEASDFVTLHIPIPSGAHGTLKVRIEAAYVSVFNLGTQFSNHDDTAHMTLTVPVMSAAKRTLRRGVSGLVAAAAFAIATLLMRRHGHKLGERDGTRSDGGLFIVGVMAWAAIGYWWWAERVVIATGFYGDGFRWLATLCWVVAPPLVAYLFVRRAAAAVPAATVVQKDTGDR